MQVRNKGLWMVLLALVAVAGIGSLISQAAVTNDIAYIDIQQIGIEYIGPLVQGPLEIEMAKLQGEFDSASKGLSDTAKMELFESYQNRLYETEQQLVNKHLITVESVAAQVAKDAGYKVVLDKDVIVAGGADITSLVLAKLKAQK
jgi:Skp family chaperone for outer membrane proteins